MVSVEYPFMTIIPCSTLIWNGSTSSSHINVWKKAIFRLSTLDKNVQNHFNSAQMNFFE